MSQDIYLTVEQVAELVHETRRKLAEIFAEKPLPSWEDCESWMKSSSILNIRAAFDNPEWTPKLEHERWVYERLSQGWTYGEVRDDHLKKNPYMKPYDDLPYSVRLKDSIAIGIIKACLDAYEK